MGYAREYPKYLYAYDLRLRALLLGGLVPLMVALAACGGGGGGGDGDAGSGTKPPNVTGRTPPALIATPKPPAPGWQSDPAQWADHRGYQQ